MFIKTTFVKTKAKTYSYVRLCEYAYDGKRYRTMERVVATLGDLEMIIRHRDTIIRGLLALEMPQPIPARAKRTKPTPAMPTQGARFGGSKIRTNRGNRSASRIGHYNRKMSKIKV